MSLISLQSNRVDDTLALAKEARLIECLEALGSLVIGYSGGVDSAYLAAVAHEVLGERAIAVIAVSPSYPEREHADAVALAGRIGIPLREVQTAEGENPDYVANPVDRCFHCKDELFIHLRKVAEQRDARHIAYGAIADDRGDHRPGARAARDHGAVAPLQDVDLSKAEIRFLSRRRGLATWDKPGMACLASRIPYGTPVTPDLLRRLEAAEDFLRDLGFRQLRVRHHDTVARIEVAPDELPKLVDPDIAAAVHNQLRALGWTHVAADLLGYRTGSLNAGIALETDPH
ncbi:MAG: ATP-dependent sacrificial sulfur transferase LarE [Armatimonadaceae bacterium]|jgi:uncharacterized protein